MSKSVRNYDKNGQRTGTSIFKSSGLTKHYDSKGNYSGSSISKGSYVKHYDSKGNYTGSSINRNGSYSHYNKSGSRTGSSTKHGSGYSHHDNHGHYTGSSGGGGGSSEGCYIATCVYGSYDCTEVLTLRHFRDETLEKNIFGRMFIKAYYAISPTLVKWFGHTEWFKKMWKGKLDYMVATIRKS